MTLRSYEKIVNDFCNKMTKEPSTLEEYLEGLEYAASEIDSLLNAAQDDIDARDDEEAAEQSRLEDEENRDPDGNGEDAGIIEDNENLRED